MYVNRVRVRCWIPFAVAAMSYLQNERTNDQNAAEARRNRNFQEDMSNTSYQRSARDLELAGLNRVLALGNGASTPSGAQATFQNSKAAESGISAASAKSAIALQRAEENLVGQKANESKSAEDLNRVAAITNAAQGQLNIANATTANAQAKLVEEQARKVRLEADRGEVANPMYQMVADLTKWLQSTFESNAKTAKDGWWPSVKKGAKDLFTDDPDKGWFDEGAKKWKDSDRSKFQLFKN